ncbi:hypothetical protein EB796_018648 [Bugula neritina]|uniref:Uncharacterized protein n=1 Tax=Bugula neritina TaxID=10212 RepID=A0A7J7JAG5_BUGNE|nr:hypothetical protein EB796_018648 [Bugula neritina]
MGVKLKYVYSITKKSSSDSVFEQIGRSPNCRAFEPKGGDADADAYDGLAAFDPSKDKKEIKAGVLAMLPDWCQEINKGTTVEDLHKQILTVRERQRQFLAHFSDNYNEEYFYDSEGYVDEALAMYIKNTLESHKSGEVSAEGAKRVASFIGLASQALKTYHLPKPLNDNLKSFRKVLHWTLDEVLPKTELGETFLPNLYARCGSNGYRNKLAADLKTFINDTAFREVDKETNHWMLLVPLIHTLGDVSNNSAFHKEIVHSFQKIKTKRNWKAWFRRLIPFITIDPELPAMLVEILSDEELEDFLRFREEVSHLHNRIPLQHILRVVSTKTNVSKFSELLPRCIEKRREYSIPMSLSNNIEGGNRDLVLEILQRINFTENDANIINASIELLPFAVKDSKDNPISTEDWENLKAVLDKIAAALKVFQLEKSENGFDAFSSKEKELWVMLYNAVVGKDDWSQKCAIKFQERLQEVSH